MKNCASAFHMDAERMDLPPGFRFHPTDQELILEYLFPKAHTSTFSPIAIAEVDLNKCEPWDLPNMAKIGENEWYFYSTRDKKYSTGDRTNRSTSEGYWKATGKDKDIYSGGLPVGMKKTLVYYKGRAPKGEKSNWIMHEYRLHDQRCIQNLPCSKIEWVICRVFLKGSPNTPRTPAIDDHQTMAMVPAEPVQMNFPPPNNINTTTALLNQQDIFQGLEAAEYMNPDSFHNPQFAPSFSDYNSSQLQITSSTNPNYPDQYTFGGLCDPNMPSSSFLDFGGGEGTSSSMDDMMLDFDNPEGPSSSRFWGGGH